MKYELFNIVLIKFILYLDIRILFKKCPQSGTIGIYLDMQFCYLTRG